MSDLISRSALIEEIERQKLGLSGNSELAYNLTLRIADIFCNIIRNQPTVEAKPVVHGEWEVNGVNPHNMTVGNWRCTECDGISLKYSDFCPNCGADMRKKVE